jgi:hypothetical protein
MSKSAPEPTVSTYYVSVHFVLCHSVIDSLKKVFVDEREAWSGTHFSGDIQINKPELFGGTDREGGIVGKVTLARGDGSQTPDPYLTSLLGTIPAFRGVTSIILKDVLVGNNYYLKPWSFLCSRIHTRQN